MIVKTQITEYDYSNKQYIVDITAEYIEFEAGSRDSFGVPLEPDQDAYFIIEDIQVDNKSYTTHELAHLLDHSEFFISELIQDALCEQLESDLYNYYDHQINDYENIYY